MLAGWPLLGSSELVEVQDVGCVQSQASYMQGVRSFMVAFLHCRARHIFLPPEVQWSRYSLGLNAIRLSSRQQLLASARPNAFLPTLEPSTLLIDRPLLFPARALP